MGVLYSRRHCEQRRRSMTQKRRSSTQGSGLPPQDGQWRDSGFLPRLAISSSARGLCSKTLNFGCIMSDGCGSSMESGIYTIGVPEKMSAAVVAFIVCIGCQSSGLVGGFKQLPTLHSSCGFACVCVTPRHITRIGI